MHFSEVTVAKALSVCSAMFDGKKDLRHIAVNRFEHEINDD